MRREKGKQWIHIHVRRLHLQYVIRSRKKQSQCKRTWCVFNKGQSAWVWVPTLPAAYIVFVVCSHSAAVNSLHSAKRALRDSVCVKGNPGFIPAFVLGQSSTPCVCTHRMKPYHTATTQTPPSNLQLPSVSPLCVCVCVCVCV